MKVEYKVTPREVEELMDKIDDLGPSKYPGMTYEQGIYEALSWVLYGEDKPEV